MFVNPPAQTSRLSPLLQKTLWWTVVVALGLPLVTVALSNIALWTGGLAAVVSGERPRSTVRMSYDWAWCIWPSHIYVTHLHLEIDAEKWQLDLEVPEGTAKIDLLALAQRTIRTDTIVGDRADLKFAMKRPFGARKADVKGFHRIEGFPEPIQDEEPRPVPPAHKAWRIELDGIETRLEHFQVDDIQVDTRGTLTGQLHVLVGHEFEVPHATFKTSEACVTKGKTIVAKNLESDVAVTIAPYDPREVEGHPMLRNVSATIDANADLEDLDWIDLPVRKMSIRHGSGRLQCDVQVKKGRIVGGGNVAYRTPRIDVTLERPNHSLRIHAGVDIEGRTPENSDEATLDVAANLSDASIGEDRPWVLIKKANAQARWEAIDLVRGVGVLRQAELHVPKFVAQDLENIGRIDPSLSLRGGALAGGLDIETHDAKNLDVRFATDIQGAWLSMGKDNEFKADGYFRVSGTYPLKPGVKANLKPLLKLDQIVIRTPKGETTGDWLSIRSAALRIDPVSKAIDLSARGEFSDLRSVLAHSRRGDDIFERVPTEGLGTDPIAFALHVSHQNRTTNAEFTKIKGGPIDAVATLSNVGGETRAAVYFKRARAGVTFGEGGRDFDLAKGDGWYDEQVAWVRHALTP